MKKVFTVLGIIAAVAAVAGGAYLLYRKFVKPAVDASKESNDEDETIVITDDIEEETAE